MLGAIAGDIIGSSFEFASFKQREFTLFGQNNFFTDDTVLTVAIADALLHDLNIARTLKEYGNRYPNAGYGGSFIKWLASESLEPYNSWGNGSAMRTSPVGFFYRDEVSVLENAKKCAEVTHNHIEGIKGAQAISFAIFLARYGNATKDIIREQTERWFGYDLSASLDEIRPSYRFDESCQLTVPPAIRSFLESKDYESAVRNAISLGGDADTLACITGGLAEAYYGPLPPEIIVQTRKRLPKEFLQVVDEFYDVVDSDR